MANEPVLRIGNYCINLMGKVGNGGFGTVYKATNVNQPGTTFAAKEIRSNGDKDKVAAIVREYENFKHVPQDNFNILQIHDTVLRHDEGDAWIFSEYCRHGDLNNYFSEYFDEVKSVGARVQVMLQIANGLNYLHFNQIVHRDVKPANILMQMKQNGLAVVRLADFGLSKRLNQDRSTMNTDAGSEKFKAPEFWMKKDGIIEYRSSVDIFATGLTYLAMLQAGENENENPALSPEIEGSFDEEVESKASIGYIMHVRRVKKQPALQLVLLSREDDQITRRVKKLILQMVCFDHKERIGAHQLLQGLLEISSVAYKEVNCYL